jgi:hypothetical protein
MMNNTRVNWLVKYTSKHTRIAILHDEIAVLESKYDPKHSKIDVLYIADTISMLKQRIKELEMQKGIDE